MKKHSERFLLVVNDAKSRIQETDIHKVKEKLERGEQFYLVDVREDSEWNHSRLPGAIHLGKGIIERDIENRIPDMSSEIILYCGGGFRSALAADSLQKMGYNNVLSMDGGFTAWKEAHLPLEKD